MSPTVEVLMAAMHQKDFTIAYQSGVESDLLIVNQCDENGYEEIIVKNYCWRMIKTTERGLAKSRQCALMHAKGDLLLFCDDDESLQPNYVQGIQKAYQHFPKADAIAFNVKRIHNHLKKTYYCIARGRIAPWGRCYGAPQLSIQCTSVEKYQLQFNPLFGSGSSWGGGEDSLFENDLRQRGGRLYEYPFEIATLDYQNESKWFHGYDERYFYNLGAYTAYAYHRQWLLKWLRRAYTCYKLRNDHTFNAYNKMKWMICGARNFQKKIPYETFRKENG